jgi:short-subunit dehydrogenase
MTSSLYGSVVVLTGASSGIGRETAVQMAKEGARLVLAARDEDALEEVVQACNERGAEAIAVATDVSLEDEVEALRDTAIDRFGGIDVWVNDAASYMMGRVDQVPSEAVRRLFEVNVMGVVHGSKAALSHFKERNKGVIINIGSVAGKAPYALASAYCATKHAVHGFTEALRQELATTPIQACLIVPATVDTPLFEHAANYTGRTIEAMRPIYPASRVAEAIVDCAKHPRREVAIGAVPRVMAAVSSAAPALYERMQPKMVEQDHLGEAEQGISTGNLFLPEQPHEVGGRWRERKPLLDLGRVKGWISERARRLAREASPDAFRPR